jgi:hypothetical protein
MISSAIFLRVVGFVGADLGRAQGEQAFAFSAASLVVCKKFLEPVSASAG